MGKVIGIGNGIGIRKGSRLNLEPEIITYLTGLSTPLSAGQVGKLNKFVRDLKTGLSISALSDAFDVMYILAGETAESSLKNLVKNAHHATAVNSPTFTQFEGYAGNGTSSYINTNWIPRQHKVNAVINNASFGVYSRTNSQASGVYDIGTMSGTVSETDNISLMLRQGNGIAYSRMYTDTAISSSVPDSLGMFIHNTILKAQTLYKNKTSLVSATANLSVIESNVELFICCRNNQGTPTGFSQRQISLVFIANSVTQSDVNVITDTFEAYMDSNGKGVI